MASYSWVKVSTTFRVHGARQSAKASGVKSMAHYSPGLEGPVASS